QDLRHREHQVGGRRALGQLTVEPEADDFGGQEIEWLTQQHGLGLDAAHAPAEYAHAVDHGGVRVGADDGIGIDARLSVRDAAMHNAREVFDVDLVDDAAARWHYAEVLERLLA